MNFKQRKVKVGDFLGMPRYADLLLEKIKSFSNGGYPELGEFKLFELCNLEYDSGRLSSIDFHKDDKWIWGERLIRFCIHK